MCIRDSDDAAILPSVIVDANLEMFIERNRDALDAVQLTINRIKTVGNIGQQDRLFVLEQRHERVRQHFVGTVANKNLLWRDSVRRKMPGDGIFQSIGIGVGIGTQVRTVGPQFRLSLIHI